VNGVVLWTRLAPAPLRGGLDPLPILVRSEVATDECFRTVVARGDIDALPGRGHSVHVAAAVIGASLPQLGEVGCERAALGLDSENSNRPFALHESLGYEVVARDAVYRKVV
jgi:hypothetical protein